MFQLMSNSPSDLAPPPSLTAVHAATSEERRGGWDMIILNRLNRDVGRGIQMNNLPGQKTINF